MIRISRPIASVIRLICRFRRSSTSWPLESGDRVEIWVDSRMIGECDADLIVELVAHAFRGTQLSQEVALAAVPPRYPLAPAIQAKQLERAKSRRARGYLWLLPVIWACL